MSGQSQIGALRHRVELLQPARIADGAGGFAESWISAGEVWARVTPQSGAEGFAADRLESAQRLHAELRTPNPAEPGWRLLWRGLLYAIETRTEPDAPGDLVALIASEIVP